MLDRTDSACVGPGWAKSLGGLRRRIPSFEGGQAPFEMFKQRLLLQWLNATLELELHARVIQEANEAAKVALATPISFLVFPCLLEERVRAALEQERQRSRIYWHDLMPQ